MTFPEFTQVKTVETKVTTTVRDIYDIYNPNPPTGWEFTGEFRIPLKGENFLAWPCIYKSEVLNAGSIGWEQPRLILRKIQRKRIIFTETGEIRLPKQNEYYLAPNSDKGFLLAYVDHHKPIDEPKRILVRTEEEI